MKLTNLILAFTTLICVDTLADSACVKIIEAKNTGESKEEIVENYCKNTRGDCIQYFLSQPKNEYDAPYIAKEICSRGASAFCITDTKKNSDFAASYISKSICANPTGGVDIADEDAPFGQRQKRGSASTGTSGRIGR